MQCPVDNTTLVMSERSGIEIDYCPQCRGVWLDRGELDKIIDRSAAQQEQQSAQPPVQQQAPAPQPDHRYNEKRYYDDYYNGHHKKRKKENFLGDLFDF